jgi:two-component sensor histidine kinase
MTSVTSFFKKLGELGTDPACSTLTNKRIEISNFISLFAVIITLGFIYYYHTLGLRAMVMIESVAALLYAAPLVLNYLKFSFFSRIYLNAIIFGHVFFLCLLLGHESNMHMFFVPTIMTPFVLFEFSQKKTITALCLFNVAMVSFLYASTFRYNLHLIILTSEQLNAIGQVVFYVAIACCVVIIYAVLYGNEKATAQLDKEKEKLSAKVEAVFDNSADALFLVDWDQRRIEKANRRAIELFEADSEADFLDKFGPDFHKTKLTPEESNAMRSALFEKGIYESEILYKTFKGNEFWGAISIKFIEANGEKLQSVRLTDISEKRKIAQNIEASLKEKELLLAEVHHRVKNNLAIISALINLQMENLKDDKSKRIFEETKDRIYSMAMIHNQLYQNHSFARIEFAQYISSFCTYLSKSYQTDQKIDINKNIEEVQLNIKTAIPCALILNELVTNSFKHAFREQAGGIIDVGLKRDKNRIHFWVADSGSGMDLAKLKSATMGMNLITSLVEQIDGNLEYENKNGSRFLITFNNN